jgi:plasmid stability protein
MHNDIMAVQITIRGVPDEVRDELAARAAQQGKSMQEFLRAELERLAARPALEKVLERIRERKSTAGTRIPATQILRHRDADRR